MEKLKASGLYEKSQEIQNFEKYQERVKDRLQELNNVQTLIKEGLEDARCFIGKAHLECHQTEEYGTRVGALAHYVYPNMINIEINSYLAMILLKAYEQLLVSSILDTAKDMNIEEDRVEAIFDQYIELDIKQIAGGVRRKRK